MLRVGLLSLGWSAVLMPVSYTHLDVYKRQRYISVAKRMQRQVPVGANAFREKSSLRTSALGP